MQYKLGNYIHGNIVEASGAKRDIYSPLDGSILAQGADSSKEDVRKAAQDAAQAQSSWANLTTKARVEVHYNYRGLLKKHRDELAEICHKENGKAMPEALAGVDKAIELTDFACSMPQLISGSVQEVSKGIECKYRRVPIGVVASITPFNFPIMVPHWTVPNALAVGNAVLLKPSEHTPISAIRSAELWKQAGLPDGLLHVVLGSKDVVEEICDNPSIAGLSFVGSTPIAKLVYTRASANLKRARCFGGAKNYLIVAEDAHPKVADDIISAFCGMAGQRCMAASVLLSLGEITGIVDAVLSQAKTLVPGITLPPLISKQAVEKISQYLDKAQERGAKILLDGRTTPIQGPGSGYYIGASIIDWRGREDEMPLEEVFGPTLELIHADSMERAAELQNRSPYGNASSIFTQSGKVAAEATKRLQAGMIGVNIGIPVPREPFSFGGIKHSRFGEGGITGWSNVEFFTDTIKITTKWNPEDRKDWMS
ncbi:methylmalonate-semialdehyde dehydrogenase [acylating]-like [Ylistrum balloti]|uniref:methylmalonate-semialdehyde dehydrogenase [acylating]-like n=1 Tax=Ylistrum balloti TaxID=509963 RepID=UPI002905B4F2|nr:methylmalonate-semialdehyde dehydrogenase [acylating]-like [Ylistrum balloti]